MRIPKRYIFRAAGQAIRHSLKSLPYTVAGLVVVLFLYRYRDIDLEDVLEQHPRLTPWINPEDWTGGVRGHEPGDNCVPDNLRDEFQGLWGFWRYHALRNSANGLRHYPWYTLKLDSNRMVYQTPKYLSSYQDWYIYREGFARRGNKFWYAIRQGDHYGFALIRYFRLFGKLRYYECKFGWRITPADARHGFVEGSTRWKYGTTPTFQPIGFGVAGSDYHQD